MIYCHIMHCQKRIKTCSNIVPLGVQQLDVAVLPLNGHICTLFTSTRSQQYLNDAVYFYSKVLTCTIQGYIRCKVVPLWVLPQRKIVALSENSGVSKGHFCTLFSLKGCILVPKSQQQYVLLWHYYKYFRGEKGAMV